MALKTKKSGSKKDVSLPDKCGFKELAHLYSVNNGCTEKEAESHIRGTVDTICEALNKGHSINFVGLFSMEVVTRAARQGRNPKTKETIEIPASKAVKFKVGATLKKSLNK